MSRCDLCDAARPTIRNEGRNVCVPCSFAEIDDTLHHVGFAVIENGQPTTYRLGLAQPRAWAYR